MAWIYQKVTLVIKWNDEVFSPPVEWDWTQVVGDGYTDDVRAELSDYSNPFTEPDD